MLIIFLILVLSVVLTSRKMPSNNYNDSFMSPQVMLPWKGLFICWIFISHLMGEWQFSINSFDNAFNIVNGWFGQIVVVLFLFLSGYGVMYSIENKTKYLKTFFIKRVLITWLNFAIVLLLYLGLQFALGNTYGLNHIVMAFIGLESIGNSNWYIFCILYLYIITYASFSITDYFFINKNIKRWFGIVCVFIFICIYIFYFKYVKKGITVWYDSIFCYLFGMIFYYVSKKIRAL